MEPIAAQAKDPYEFARRIKSIIRLNYFHVVTANICGYIVHPSISRTGESLRIADIGAGTGVWSVNAIKEFPEDAVVTAIDNSDAQFFAKDQLPDRVETLVHDCFNPFDEKYHEFFDVINIRYFKSIVNDNNIEVFVRNLVQTLKPGGHLQWTEFDPVEPFLHRYRPDVPTPWLDKFVKLGKDPRSQLSWNWKKSAQYFEKEGLQIAFHRTPWQKWHINGVMNFFFMTIEDRVEKLRQDGNNGYADELMAFYTGLPNEVGLGSGTVQDFIFMVARKDK